MGFIIERSPAMGEFSAEVRSESFYFSGAKNFCWVREELPVGRRAKKTLQEGKDAFELSDDDAKPEGEGWACEYVTRRHAMFVYADGPSRQGTVKPLIEDIPKIRATLDAVELHVAEREGRRPSNPLAEYRRALMEFMDALDKDADLARHRTIEEIDKEKTRRFRTLADELGLVRRMDPDEASD